MAKLDVFVQDIIGIFIKKIRLMGNMRAHKPYVEFIKRDKETLEKLQGDIQALSTEKEALLNPSLYFLLIEKIVPIFRRWKARFNSAPADVDYHKEAEILFGGKLQDMFGLVVELDPDHPENSLSEPDEVASKARDLLKQYDHTRYLNEHEVADFLLQEKEDVQPTRNNNMNNPSYSKAA